jgi:hypothetical protein
LGISAGFLVKYWENVKHGRKSAMAQGKTKKKSVLTVVKKLSVIIMVLFLVYVMAGFWIIPPLLKPRLEKELSSQIGRKITIEEIKINPLALSATTTNLAVYETDGKRFAGFKELLIDAELSSILKWAVTFKLIRVKAPFGVLKILPDYRLNISDILDKHLRADPEPQQAAELPHAIITKLQVEDGKFTVENLSQKEPKIETFSPISFELTNLSTLKERQGTFTFVGVGAYGGKYQLDGQLSLNPVRIQGRYSVAGTRSDKYWDNIKDHVSFQLKKGIVNASGNYVLELIEGKLHAALKNGAIELKDFQLAEKGKEKVLISIPSLLVGGIGADVNAQELVIEQVKTADARLESWLAADGSLMLKNWLLPDLQKLMEMKKTNSAEIKKAASKPWRVAIHKIEVITYGAAIEDRTLPKPARISVDNINAKIENLDNKKNSKATVDIAFQINQAGAVKVNGSAGIDPLAAELNVISDKMVLKSFQPYVDTAVNALIQSGTTSSKGRVLFKDKGNSTQISYHGELSLDGLKIDDRIQTGDFIRLEQFKAAGIVLELNPNRLHAANILINKPHTRVTIDQNGTINVVQAFTPIQKEQGKGEENLLQRLVNFLIMQIQGPMPMDIGMVQLHHFTANFIDRSITPPYETHLEIAKGTMKGLSSDPSARADFNIEGTLDRSAPIESAGQMSPLNAMQYTKVAFSLKDFNLKPTSPYSGKYAGYKISEGTLGLDLKYSVDENTLDGDNRIYIDHLELGEKVDSPDATTLPVALGVALLKDANGRISLQVPVGGDVKDPQFDFGQAIKSALTGTMDNVSSSPFSAITEIDGFKGEDLRFIEFAFGLSELSARATKKLNALAKFLNERTALTLDIEGIADQQRDWDKMSGTQKSSRKQKTSKAQAADDTQLKALAQMRAEKVKTYLIQKGSVAEKRVKLKPVKIIAKTQKGYASVGLSLSVQ